MDIHKKNWDFLKSKFEAGQLSHAYLLSGQEGSGKKEFAKKFAKLINCQKSDTTDQSCENCQNCTLIEKETFPDLVVVTSGASESSVKNEKDMMEIDVAQIREVNNFLSYKAYYGSYKTVIVDNAERMNQEAQSCFLKTLEEPKGKTIIFLIAKNPELLLPTIASRCQTIAFFPFNKYKESKTEQETLQDLLGVINAELAVKFQYAKKVNLEGDNLANILKTLQRYFRNMLLATIGALPGKATNYPIGKLKKIIRLIESLHRQTATTNANSKLELGIAVWGSKDLVRLLITFSFPIL